MRKGNAMLIRTGGVNSDETVICRGGASFGCRRDEHVQRGEDTDMNGKKRQVERKDVVCYRCQTRMGCTLCVQIARELICLNCHNWATRKGLAAHGNVVPNPKVPQVTTDDGVRTYVGDGRDRFDSLMAGLVNCLDKLGIKLNGKDKAQA